MRTEKHNQLVEGHEDSKHRIEMGGYGVDLWPDNPQDLEFAETTAEQFGLWAEVKQGAYGSYLHVQGLRPGPYPF
jgi:hypothetical protein